MAAVRANARACLPGSPAEYIEKKVVVGNLSGGQAHLIRILAQLAGVPMPSPPLTAADIDAADTNALDGLPMPFGLHKK